jgi:hypothetical protein
MFYIDKQSGQVYFFPAQNIQTNFLLSIEDLSWLEKVEARRALSEDCGARDRFAELSNLSSSPSLAEEPVDGAVQFVRRNAFPL